MHSGPLTLRQQQNVATTTAAISSENNDLIAAITAAQKDGEDSQNFSLLQEYLGQNSREDLFKNVNELENEKQKQFKIAVIEYLKSKIKNYHNANVHAGALDGIKENKTQNTDEQENNNRSFADKLSNFGSYIIPAKKGEWGKIFILGVISFLLVFSYSVLRIPKDLLIISVGGAELIPFLKIIGILPATMISSWLWGKVKEWCQTDVDEKGNPTDASNKSFYIAIGLFAAFFVGFIVLFPYLGAIQGFSIPLSMIPSGVTSIFSYWAYSLFYVFTEMWAVITIDGIFKGMQTALFKKDRVKALSASFGIWSNLGLMVAGIALNGIFGISGLSLYTQLFIIIGLFTVSCAIVMALHLYAVNSENFVFAKLQNKANGSEKSENTKKEEEKEALNATMSLSAEKEKAAANTSEALNEIKKIASSCLNDGVTKDNGFITKKELDNILEEDGMKDLSNVEKNYVRKAFNASGGFFAKLAGIASHWDLRDLAIVVLAYNICLVLFEVVWKNQVKIFTSSGASTVSYVQFMGQFNLWTAVISIALALLNPLINMMPPEAQALMTPVLLGILSAVFFGLVLAPTTMAAICPFLFSSSITNLYWQIALVGTIQNVIVKASKYSVFEPVNTTSWAAKPKFVKESYQDTVNQITGKWGKGIGSLILLGLLAYGGTLTNILPYIPIVIGLILAAWSFSAYNVSTTISGKGMRAIDIDSNLLAVERAKITAELRKANPESTFEDITKGIDENTQKDVGHTNK